MLTIDKLKAFGADTTTGLSRCLNNEMLYLRLVSKFLEDTNIYTLKEAVLNKDYDKAFECAHALKGVLANLSIAPLYDIIVNITEDLRNKKDMDYILYVDKYIELLNELKSYNN